MFRKKAIDEWAIDYWLLQQYAKLCYKIYYRKVEIINRHNIPLNQPVILAPNHQNALMDAMVLVCNLPFQAVFLARADIFKGKRLTRLLTFMNIMPIYRMRDGIENVKRNDVVFEKTVHVLNKKNNPLGMFAEGNHGDKRRLRPLVKGLFRIAILAQEEYGNEPGVKIVPIGIDYGHYQHFRTTVYVNIGEPIEIAPFYNKQHDNPAIDLNNLKDAFADALSKLMIDIQTEEYYDLYMNLREIYNDEMREEIGIGDDSLTGRFRADKSMIERLNHELKDNPDGIRELNTLVSDYQASVKKAGLRDWVLKKDRYSLPGLILSGLAKLVLLPVFIFGFLNNYLPYWFTSSRVENIKDTQFRSSFKYVVGMIVFPVWYIVIAGILAFLSMPIGWIVLYILFLPVTGVAAFEYFIRFKKLAARCRYTLHHSRPDMIALRKDRRTILDRMHVIINRHKTNHESAR